MARLGELERSVMNVLWDADGSLSVRDVQDSLEDRRLAYTTVMTVLDRLGSKDMVDRERDGRAYRYTPRQSRQSATAELIDEALEASGDRTSALVHFARTVDPVEAEALRRALDEM